MVMSHITMSTTRAATAQSLTQYHRRTVRMQPHSHSSHDATPTHPTTPLWTRRTFTPSRPNPTPCLTLRPSFVLASRPSKRHITTPTQPIEGAQAAQTQATPLQTNGLQHQRRRRRPHAPCRPRLRVSTALPLTADNTQTAKRGPSLEAQLGGAPAPAAAVTSFSLPLSLSVSFTLSHSLPFTFSLCRATRRRPRGVASRKQNVCTLLTVRPVRRTLQETSQSAAAASTGRTARPTVCHSRAQWRDGNEPFRSAAPPGWTTADTTNAKKHHEVADRNYDKCILPRCQMFFVVQDPVFSPETHVVNGVAVGSG